MGISLYINTLEDLGALTAVADLTDKHSSEVYELSNSAFATS